ncbi:potassium transporter KefB [Salinimicrobium sp. CAU 1759]
MKRSDTQLVKTALTGAALALIFIAVFLFGVDQADPSWPQYWKLKPFFIVPLAGAIGGVFYHLMGYLRTQGSWKKVLGFLVGILGYITILWLETVLGLNGTLWH